ncbi:hypothetical protein AB0A69_32160 [Streptomyces sp. NPDC045431]|uniref:hypothetical protein n=1 Tax=Streptomyces sp. NPDC045431 TaxID=3155613 RepID=UPI0033DE53AC
MARLNAPDAPEAWDARDVRDTPEARDVRDARDARDAESARGLARQLAAMGTQAAKGGPGHRLRAVALALATAFLGYAVAVVVVALAAYDVQREHERARAPRFIGEFPGEKPAAQWRESGDTVDGLQHTVVFVEPLTADAPPPPGVPRWPAPGSAVLSPALAEAGADAGIASRYGRDAGRISAAGLTSPSERLVYVRPPAGSGEWDESSRISGFGDERPVLFGDSVTVLGPDKFVPAAIGFLGLPAAVLAVIAARCGSAARDRRTAVLHALGGRRRHRALLSLGEAAGPVLAGAALGLVPLTVLAATDVTLPFTGYRLASATVLGRLPLVLSAIAVAAATVLLCAVLLNRATGDGRSPRTATDRPVKRRSIMLCALGIGLSLPVDLGPLSPHYRVSLAQYALGTVLTLATLPAVVAWAMTGFGRLLARRAGAKGWCGALIAGRWLHTHPAVIARLVVAVVVGLGLVSQVQLWTSRTTGAAAEARDMFAALGDSVLVVRTRPLEPTRLDAFQRELGPGRVVFSLRRDPTGESVLTGPCAALASVGQPCPGRPTALREAGDRRLTELQRWEAGRDGLRVVTGAVSVPRPSADSAVEHRLVVISARGDTAAGATVRRAAYRHLGMAPVADVLGGSQVGGDIQYEAVGRWVVLLGLGGMLVTALAAAVSALAEFGRFADRLAPMGVLTGEGSVFRSTALWYLSVPLAAAGVAAAVVCTVLGYPMVTTGGARPSPELVLLALFGSLLLAGCVGVAGGRGVVVRARHWRPKAD